MDQRIAELEATMKMVVEHQLIFWGRLNALEHLMALAVLDFAKMQPAPFDYVQSHVERVRHLTNRLLGVEGIASEHHDRLIAEEKRALGQHLEDVLNNAGPLRTGD